MTYPKIGNKAPSFNLKKQDGSSVKLADLSGKKVVLYFYPRAMTPGCTTQACGLRDINGELTERGVSVFGVSPDPVDKLQKFIDKHSLNFDLLSDPDHAVAEKYGVWGLKKFMGKEFMGIVRTTFIINEAGKLIHIMDKFKTSNHHEELLSFLNSQS